MTDLSPREIVSELDRHIIGQADAKRAVAIALRNRWRRRELGPELRDEVTPKNILMIGPTGVGKTEIARRLAKLASAPFLKVEATKFTEIGYVGRDVEQIMRDLLEVSIGMVRDRRRLEVRARARAAAEERVLSAWLRSDAAREEVREAARRRLRANELDNDEIEIELADGRSPFQGIDIPGMPGASVGMLNLGDMLGRGFGQRLRRTRMTVAEAFEPLINEESDKLLDEDKILREAKDVAEHDGIVFIDEIDKITARSDVRGADISREGVQRDLLPLLEGTTVPTKHGPIRSDYVLFVASGAFHIAKPSDMLPELQGRLPIRVELSPLAQDDFRRILIEPEASLVKQYTALLATEGVALQFTDDGVDALARLAADVNATVENIGARRLQTVLEKLLEDVSFRAPDMGASTIVVDAAYVRDRVGALAKDADLSKFIL